MAFSRRNKFLECFYCGRKSSMRFNGQPSFECLSCDATNYLDENGEITDPPAAATGASTPAKVTYAVPRTASPPRPSGTIFCNTCLNNQRLFTASIAQYLPDDPDAPDYAEREKQYYDFRKRLEKIYPQICAECEPKVRKRIAQAAYTAKTDVLRRMIDQSKTNKTVTRRSWLDVSHLLGRWLWLSGFTLEIVSHILGVLRSEFAYCATQESASWACSLVTKFAPPILRALPEQGRLLRWSFYAGLSSCWWNPRFVQTVRGFTKHLVGLLNWYIYQAIVVSVRLFSLRFLGDATARTRTAAADLAIHLLLIASALMVLRFATTCVRVDTTPLFGAKSNTQPLRHDSPEKVDKVQQAPKVEGVKNMSDLLDEILESPSLAGQPLQPLRRPGQQPSTATWGSKPPPTSFARKPNLDLDALSLSHSAPRPLAPQQTPRPLSPQHSFGLSTDHEQSDEMDWSPSTSQHRAFSSFRGPDSPEQLFSQAPTTEKKGPFWYRVPPAPVSPAQRMTNPPNQPRLRTTLPRSPETATFRPAEGTGNAGAASNGGDAGVGGVTFAKPSFFPPTPDDPRNGLADMLEGSFTLRQREEARKGWIGGLFAGKKSA